MSFENLVNEMRNTVIQENNAEQEFFTSVKNELCRALRGLAYSTFEAMKKGLAKQIILNPQNQSYDYYQVPSKTSFRVLLPSEYRSLYLDYNKRVNHPINDFTNRLDISCAKFSEDYVYYDVHLIAPIRLCKTRHFDTFFRHLQYIAEKEGFRLYECNDSSGPHIQITYQRTITPQGTITNQRTIPQPVTNAPKENENGSSKPNWLARAGDIIETLLLYSWVGLIVFGLIVFFLCL